MQSDAFKGLKVVVRVRGLVVMGKAGSRDGFVCE